MFSFLKNLFCKKEQTIEETMMVKDLLTLEELYKINNNLNKSACEAYIRPLNDVLRQYNINTLLQVCHFLAQVLHESGNLKYEIENLNYSASALRSVFGKYFKTDNEAQEYARKPEKIANRVYANRMGNGSEESGDGWNYRGRGLIQLTGRANYTECGKAINSDLINNPDLICNDKEISIKVACWFWNKNNLNQYADKDDIISITKRVNGGLNGIESRKEILERAKLVLKI